MNAKPTSYGSSISIGRDNNGNAAIGERVMQVGRPGSLTAARVEDLEAALARLEPLLAQLEQAIATEAPPEKRAAAEVMAGELKETLMSGKPKISTLETVKDWFERNAPKLAGMVTGIVVHPIVGKLVEVAGEALASEFRKRFGLPES